MSRLHPQQVAIGLWRLPTPMPEGHWIDTANVYVILDAEDDIHLVDSGWDSEAGWQALETGVASLGHQLSRVRSITLTHLHQDHRGLANRIREVSGAAVRMHSADATTQGASRGPTAAELRAWGVPDDVRSVLLSAEPPPPEPTEVDQELQNDDRLDVAGRLIRVVHTPGHSPGSICLALPAEEVILTGDHVLPDFYPGVGLSPTRPGQDALGEYLKSLDRLEPMRGWRGLPGHGGTIDDLGSRVDATKAHQRKRGESARARRADAPGETVWQVAAGLHWGPGWDGLRDWHRVSALRQTAMHLSFTDLR